MADTLIGNPLNNIFLENLFVLKCIGSGRTYNVSKEALVTYSEYFAAMLSQDFKVILQIHSTVLG